MSIDLEFHGQYVYHAVSILSPNANLESFTAALCLGCFPKDEYFSLFFHDSGESMENALRACCKGIKIGKILIHRDGDNGKQVTN